METIPHRVLALWQSNPGRRFCTFAEGTEPVTLSYDQLVRRAWSFARRYRMMGVAAGEVVLIVLHHTPDAAPAFLGAMLAGAVPSFMAPLTIKQDSGHYWHGMAALLQRIGGRVLVTFAAYRDQVRQTLPHLSAHVLAVEDVEAAAAPGAIPATVAPESVAFLQHSSGTTGLKKGVALSHRVVLTQVDTYAAVLGLGDGDSIATWLPLYHDMGLNACLMPALLRGVPLVALDPLAWVVRPALLWDAVEHYRCTLMWQPNFAFHHLARFMGGARQWDLSSLRAVIDCAEPCKPETFAMFAHQGLRHGLRPEAFQVSYAMAENVFAVTQTTPGRPVPIDRVDRSAFLSAREARPAAPGAGAGTLAFLSCGMPLPGVRVAIRDEAGHDLPERQVGEITISGDHLFDGYFRLPDETRRKLRDGWYASGDLGYMAGGAVFVTGRKDDLLIVYGRNYYAHEIEFTLRNLPGLIPGRSVALGIANAETGSQDVVMVAESRQNAPDDLAGLARQVKMRILAETGLMVASVRIVPPGWLIKTSSGKISRTDNLARYLALSPETPP